MYQFIHIIAIMKPWTPPLQTSHRCGGGARGRTDLNSAVTVRHFRQRDNIFVGVETNNHTLYQSAANHRPDFSPNATGININFLDDMRSIYC